MVSVVAVMELIQTTDRGGGLGGGDIQVAFIRVPIESETHGGAHLENY